MAAKKMPAKKMPAKKVAAKKSSSGSSKSPGGGEAAQRKKSASRAKVKGITRDLSSASRVLPGVGSLVTMSPSDAIKKAKKKKK